MAVGIVVGVAFLKIASSFVNNILIPPILALLKDSKFSEMKFVLQSAIIEREEVIKLTITFNYGGFI